MVPVPGYIRCLRTPHDEAYGAVWCEEYDTLADIGNQYGAFTPGRKHGMTNSSWGVDREKGDFYLFTFQDATNVLRLLVKHSHVQFGGMVWHQQIGIPMGINGQLLFVLL